MACTYTYKGKAYSATEFDDVLRAMSPTEASRFMPSVSAVPDAPMIGDTRAWVSLGIKRAIQQAIDSGVDGVVFATGSQNADLYDLSKQVDSIEWYPSAKDGVGDLQAFRNGESVIFKKDVSSKELPDIIGKDAADKLLNNPTDKTPGRNGDTHTISGESLKVGGEGMRAFYDTIVPSVANDVLKKLGGGKVGAVDVDTVQRMSDFKITERDDGSYSLRGRIELDADFAPFGVYPTRELAEQRKSEIQDKAAVMSTQPGFLIPDSLKSKVQTEGLPLFRRGLTEAESIKRVVRVQAVVNDIKSKWKNAPKIIVVADMQDANVPQQVRDLDTQMKGQGATGEPRGFITNGTVYIVAGQQKSVEDVMTTLAHESLGHAGLRGLYGDALKPILKQIVTLRSKDVAAKAREYGLDVSKQSDLLIAAEEVLAEMAETQPEIGFVKRAIAAIRKWLRDNGLKLNLTDADIIANFIMPARSWIENGGKPVSLKQSLQASFSRTRIVGDSGRQYTQAQQEAMGRTGSTVTIRTPQEVVKSLWQDSGKKLAQGLVDQFRPVRDLSDHAYTLLRLSKGATGAFEAFINHGKLSLRDGAFDADTTGGVMQKVFFPLGKESTDFLRWIAGNRAERLLGEGKERLFSPEDIEAFKSLDSGTSDFDYTLPDGRITRDRTLIYRDSLKKFNEFNKNVLDMAEQSGLIDPESRKFWEHEFYVPFYRAADEEDGGVRGMNIKSGVIRQQAFQKLNGGEQVLNDLLENTLMNWAHLIDASSKNRAAQATLEAAEALGKARKATYGEKKTVWHMGKVVHTIPKGQSYTENGVDKVSDGTATIQTVGKVEYVVDDPYLMTAISSLEYAGLRGPAMDAMSAVKHWLTIGVTASPFFKVRNLIRDSVQAIATGDLGYNPAANIAKGYKLTDRAAQEYVSALAGGGLIRFGLMLEGSEAARTRQLIKNGNKEASILDSESKVRAFYDSRIEPAIAAYNEIGNRGEEINRMALYDTLIKQGKDHATASLMARDLMDFSMQGSWTSIRFLTQIVPFMNARLQGLYKLGRASKEDPARMATVLGGVTLASLALLVAYGDDDDWKRREDWDRDNYWWFKFGGEAFRIPKPFEIGAIATLAERSAELVFDSEMTGKRFRQTLMNNLSNQLSMNPTPQLVKPIIDLYANNDSFTGRPIETQGMEKVDPEYRFRSSTSMVARGVSTAGNAVTGGNFLSPVQVDHVVRAYMGWLGTFAVGMADTMIRGVSDEPTGPTADYMKNATGGMIAGLDGARSRYVTQMYDQAKEIEQAYGTWRSLLKQGKTEEAATYREDNADMLKKYRSVEFIKRQSAKINDRIRQVERGDMTGDEKRDAINVLRNRQDEIAQRLSAP